MSKPQNTPVGGGFVMNLSGFRKPVQIYLRYVCRPTGHFRDFLRRHRLGILAEMIEYLVRKGLGILLGWFHADVFDVDFSKYEPKTLGLSNNKNKDKNVSAN